MKAFFVFLIIGVLSYVAALYSPWWSIAIVAFAVTLFAPLNPFGSFLTAFLAGFVLWFGMAFFIDLANDHIMGSRIAVLFLKSPIPVAMAAVSGFAGGIVAGMAALTASFLRVRKKIRAVPTYQNI